nr:epoxide hydrolase N-terminal domain-containing protein [Pseudomonas sp. ANT_J28]
MQPFHVNVADKELADLRNRIAATRWPDKETVSDRSQGAQLAQLQALVRCWGLYWENMGRNPLSSAAQKTTEITLPVAVTVFPEDVYCPPETWARRAYSNLLYFHQGARRAPPLTNHRPTP